MIGSSYTIGQIAGITGGTIVQQGPPTGLISDLLLDSRRLVNHEETLFIALKTDRNDGHRYLGDLYELGVRFFIVSNQNTGYQIPEAGIIFVQDTLKALQELVAFHRKQFTYPVIGITGSNGKTIVKEWLFQILSPDYHIIRSPKSFNSQIGVPLSVWNMSSQCDLAIFEAGISRPGEMENLERIIRPTIGILTNIGQAHDEFFQDHREKTYEKLTLFKHAGILIYCSDDPVINTCIHTAPLSKDIRKFAWSRIHSDVPLAITGVYKQETNTTLEATFHNQQITLKIPFLDEGSIENAIHCIALLLYLNYPVSDIRNLISELVPIAMRMELKEAINHCSLINDSYNSDIHSLRIALDFLNQQKQHPKTTLILSDILQSGRKESELYQEIGQLVYDKKVSRFIGIGPEIGLHANQFDTSADFFETTDDFLHYFPLSTFQNEAILLKGARRFEFEKIGRALQKKTHETVLEINLDAIVHNLNFFRSKLKPDVKTMVMVKAFSYGSGSYEIANLLQFHRVDYLAVAYADEGVELRKAGITLPIMVMSPEEESMESLLKYNLEPEIYNFRILQVLEQIIDHGIPPGHEVIKIHLKLDSGMHRLGFCADQIPELVTRLKTGTGIKIQSVFTHLAASEDPDEDAFTHNQFRQFEEMSGQICSAFSYQILRHMLNSAGISRFPAMQMDMARLGIGLYGVGVDPVEQTQLRNVSTLKSVIIQIKKARRGESIGYNLREKVRKDFYFAIVPMGYADGIDRRLGNRNGTLFIQGIPVPIIGNVCMDLCMLDLTPLSDIGISVNEGEQVILFGDIFTPADLANLLGTIPYEILTSISTRVKRVYYYE